VHGARYNVISILGKRVTLVTPHSVDAMARASSYLSALSEPNQPNVNQLIPRTVQRALINLAIEDTIAVAARLY
jgi:hypothetical protein